jgi:hypothetical protein
MRIMAGTTLACAGLVAGWCTLWADPARDAAVTLFIDGEKPGAEIPTDFAGLSFEMQTVLPGKTGPYFSGASGALLQTFRNLGIRSLRIGGNTADNPLIPFPSAADADGVFSFAKAAGAGVIFTFRLRAGGPQDAAPLARHLVDRDTSRIVCFAIGNEPDIYAKTYTGYRDELKQYMAAFEAAGARAPFCGPGTTPSEPEWARQFAHDFGDSGKVRLVTQHAYPGASGRKVTDGAAGRHAMLSPEWVAGYETFYRSFAPEAEANGVRYRIEETNSYYHGGAKDASDTFAAALWGLDYMHWWALHGAAGLNFHTGDQVAAADESTTCIYAVFLTAEHGYAIQPLGYAMKAFELGGHGRVAPVRLEGAGINLRAYGVLAANSDLYVTVINKESGPDGQNAAVTFSPGKRYGGAEILRLEAPGGNVAAKSGLMLGGAAIRDNGEWSGVWRPVHADGGRVVTGVPAGSAAILRFRLGQ